MTIQNDLPPELLAAYINHTNRLHKDHHQPYIVDNEKARHYDFGWAASELFNYTPERRRHMLNATAINKQLIIGGWLALP